MYDTNLSKRLGRIAARTGLASPPYEPHPLLQATGGLGHLAPPPGDRSQQAKAIGDAARVPQFSVQSQARLGQALCSRIVALLKRHMGARTQDLDAQGDAGPLASGEG